jgi:hypothetical protein
MTKKTFLFLILLFPTFLFAQSAFSHCDHVYTSVQHLPSLKISKEAFEDTLATELKSKKFPLKNDNEITYHFVVTSGSQIDDLQAVSGSVEKEKFLREAILKLCALWKPATQNGYEVCSYVSLKIQFVDGKIIIDILP